MPQYRFPGQSSIHFYRQRVSGNVYSSVQKNQNYHPILIETDNPSKDPLSLLRLPGIHLFLPLNEFLRYAPKEMMQWYKYGETGLVITVILLQIAPHFLQDTI